MRSNTLWVWLAVLGVVFLTACGPITIPIGPMSAAPKPGARLVGSIEMGEKARSGTISFTVSEDGASITDLSVTLNDVTCDGISAGRYSDILGSLRAPITNGTFATSLPAMGGTIEKFKQEFRPRPTVTSLSNLGEMEGRFSSPTEASGTIKIFLGIPLSKTVCELGTFRWSAKAT